jgi:hypothetical protein
VENNITHAKRKSSVTLKLNDWRNINIQQNNLTFKTGRTSNSNPPKLKSGVGLHEQEVSSSTSSEPSELSCASCEHYIEEEIKR